jgi:hypothetical protein
MGCLLCKQINPRSRHVQVVVGGRRGSPSRGFHGGVGVRVFDPTGTVGMSAIIEGGFLVEDGVAVEASERLGLVPMTEPQSE